MATEKENVDEVQAERDRCVALLEFYRREFEGTKLIHLWTRIRNQIAMGTPIDKADFLTQMSEDDEHDDNGAA